MKRTILIAATLLAVSLPARADIVIVANDEVRAALLSELGAALAGNPGHSPRITYLLNLINTAPMMTGQNEIKPDEPKPSATAKPAAKPAEPAAPTAPEPAKDDSP